MRELLSRPKVAVGVVYVTVLFMSIMDATIVNVALPSIGRDLHVGATNVDQVSIGYLVSLAIVIPASGWFGDHFGGKRVLLTAIVVFTVASVLCGLAQSFVELVGFRILQGVGGGMLTPVGMAMLYRVFPQQERVRASSILVVPTALAPAIGPVLGGVLVDSLSWRWVFFVNLPLGLLALAYGVTFLRDTDLPPAGRFDVSGFLLSGVGFAALMYGVSEGPDKGWGSTQVVGTIAAGAVLLLALVVVQLRTREPLLNLRLLGNHIFRTSTAALFLATAAFLGVLYLVALFFQDGLGLDALGSGLATFPEAVGVIVGAQVVTRLLYPALGPRRIMVGGLLAVAGLMTLMTQIDDRGDLWTMRGLMFLLGYAMAHCFVPSQAAAFAQISAADTGRGSTLFNALRQLGGAIGVAVLTSVIIAAGVGHALVQGGGHGDLHPYHVAFVVAAFVAVAAALVSLAVRDEDAESTRVRRRRATPAATEPALID